MTRYDPGRQHVRGLKRGADAPLKKSTIDDDGVTVETGLRSPSPGPSASTKVKVTPGIDETDL